MASQPRRLLDQVRARAQARHYSRRTEDAYVSWIRRFILFHDRQHPRDLDARDVSTFLTHLATQRKVAASTQNQALEALLFLYGEVLKIRLEPLELVRARKALQRTRPEPERAFGRLAARATFRTNSSGGPRS
jgi:site-specific recombinase XerD